MFAAVIQKRVVQTNANYSFHNESMHVDYNEDGVFQASLDILTIPKEKAEEMKIENSFGSLVFFLYNKTSNQKLRFNIIKMDNDNVIINVSDEDKSFSFYSSKTKEIMLEIARRVRGLNIISILSEKCFTDNFIITQPKKVLEKFSALTKELLDSSEPSKNYEKALDNIKEILGLELCRFADLIRSHKDDSVPSKPRI